MARLQMMTRHKHQTELLCVCIGLNWIDLHGGTNNLEVRAQQLLVVVRLSPVWEWSEIIKNDL